MSLRSDINSYIRVLLSDDDVPPVINGEISARFGEDAGMSRLNLKLSPLLKKGAYFSEFVPFHARMANELIGLFMRVDTQDDFLAVATYCKPRLNERLFRYAFSVAVIHRKDTRHIPLPNPIYTDPNTFIPPMLPTPDNVEKADTQPATTTPATTTPTTTATTPAGPPVPPARAPVALNFDPQLTSNARDREQLLAFFREDIGINLHHYHWHLVYPTTGPVEVVRKSRRGELFYYMHSQILHRYNIERVTAGLYPTNVACNLFTDVIEPGYFPKIDATMASYFIPARMQNSKIQDIYREIDRLEISSEDIRRMSDRVINAISLGSAVNSDGKLVSLRDKDEIDTIGNMVESTMISINRNFYGNLHNLLHTQFAFIHDPTGSKNEPPGVLSSSATAMRDPAFYLIHTWVEYIFDIYKRSLPPYTVSDLEFNGVRVTSVEAKTEKSTRLNNLYTFNSNSTVTLDQGLDFISPGQTVNLTFTHLNHCDFSICAKVQNSGPRRTSIMRVFLLPVNDISQVEYDYEGARTKAIEIDRTEVILSPGENTICRRSVDSTLTIPYDRMFKDLEKNRPPEGSPDTLSYNMCGCGWPHHMLIPKGNANGYPMHLFVMFSDGEKDIVPPKQTKTTRCTNSQIFCGREDDTYPDNRPMGYPFDRPRQVFMFQDSLTPNMGSTRITINNLNQTLPYGQFPVLP